MIFIMSLNGENGDGGRGGVLGQAGKALIHNTLCAKVERNQGCVIKGNQSHRETFKDLSFFCGRE